MTHFRTDNTEGYSATDLAELNAAFEACGLPEDDANLRQHVGEKLLAAFDNGKRGADLVAAV